MNILCLTREESHITALPLLDWLTAPDKGCGVNHERYWLIKSSTSMNNVNNDPQVDILSHLLMNCVMNNYESLMITK